MKYTVYIFLSLKDHKLYVGCTKDFKSRLDAHNKGLILSTKNRTPLIALATEEFTDKGKAFNRERFLKSLWSSRYKRKLRQEYFKNKNKSL